MRMLAQPNLALTHRFPVFSNTQERSATIHDSNHKLFFGDLYERRLALHQTNHYMYKHAARWALTRQPVPAVIFTRNWYR